MSKGLGEQLTYSGSSLDARETIILQEEQTIDNAITNISNAYPGLRVKVIERLEKSDFTGELLSFKIYEIKKTSNRNKPLPANQGGYELIQEPKDLKYSDDTSFLNSNNEIDIDTLKLKNIPELQPHPMLDGFYYTISNNTPWEGQILTTPIYHINNQYLEISIPSILSNPSNLGEFSQSLITTYSELEGKQLEISIFNINKCSNGYLSSNSSYKFKIPLDTTSDKTVIETEDGINLECGIGIQTNYQLTVSLPENEPNISDYRVVLSFSNIQDVSGKIDKISNSTNGNLPKLNSEGNLVDSGISADSILTKVTGTNLNGKLATLDTNGNITNSGKSLSDLRAELDNEYIPKPSTDPTDGQILSYDETNETTKWIDNTKVHIKYAATDTPTESQMHNSIQSGDLYIGIYSDNNQSDSTDYTDYEWSKIVGIDGKSAYQQWREAGYTGDETDFLNSLKAHIAGFKSVSYDANAPTTIGGTASTIDSFSPSVDTMDKIVLMPNSDNTATIMYITTATESGGTTTYAFSCIGELNIDTSDFLDSSNVDETGLVNPTTSQVAKATDVIGLAAKLKGVTAKEDKMPLDSEQSNAINGNNGELWTDSWGGHFVVSLISGTKRVRFLASEVSNQSTYPYGYCFYSDNEGTTAIKSELYKLKEGSNNQSYELIVEVPDNAVIFKFSVASANRNNAYCYLQSGETVCEAINSLDEKYSGSTETEEIEVNLNTLDKIYVQFGNTTNLQTVAKRGLSGSYYSKWVNVTDCSKIKIRKNSGYNVYLTFLNVSQGLPKGNVTLEDLKNDKQYLSDFHHNSTTQKWKAVKEYSPSPDPYIIDVPHGAKRAVFTKAWKQTDNSGDIGDVDRLPDSVVKIKYTHNNGLLDNVNDRINEVSFDTKRRMSGEPIKLIKGDIDDNGNIIESANTIITEPIHCNNGIYLYLKSGYKAYQVLLIDHVSGKIVNKNYLTGNTSRRFIRTGIPATFDIIIKIRKSDESDITSVDGIVEEFAFPDTYKHLLPLNVEENIYYAFKKKLQTLLGIVWTPLNQVPYFKIGFSGSRYVKDETNIGLNYSGNSQMQKHVGIEVSVRTFLTACKNPRSVMYTECISSSTKLQQTKYGYTYTNLYDEGSAYYGTVCTGLSSYMAGLKHILPSASWTNSGWANQNLNIIISGGSINNGIIPPIVKASDNSTYSYDSKQDYNALAQLLQPMDFVWNTGHCAVISDIILGEYGEVKYIMYAESTTPLTRILIYTPKTFFEKLKAISSYTNDDDPNDKKEWKVFRKKAWTLEDVKLRDEEDEMYAIVKKSSYSPEKDAIIDPNITTFIGEYASFVIGDYTNTINDHKCYLNIHRGGVDGFTHLQIFNEIDDELSASPFAEIDISSNGGNVMQSNILDVDESTNEDWIIYNLASYWYGNNDSHPLRETVGKFKARVVKKTEDVVVTASGCTHFMMTSITMNKNNNILNYSVNGARPFVIRNESSAGIVSYFRDLNDISPDQGENDKYTSRSFTIPSSYTASYFRLMCDTEYGVVSLRVANS